MENTRFSDTHLNKVGRFLYSVKSTASGEWSMLAFPLRILSGTGFLELSGAFPVNSQVCFYNEFIFPLGQMPPCPWSDTALGRPWSAGSSQKRVAASEAKALGPSPSVQCCWHSLLLVSSSPPGPLRVGVPLLILPLQLHNWL